MKWTDTPESSNISGFAFEEKHNVLYIEFQGKHIYFYAGVPRSIYQSFRTAPSKGKFFHAQIKNYYPHSGNLRSDRSGLVNKQLEFLWDKR